MHLRELPEHRQAILHSGPAFLHGHCVPHLPLLHLQNVFVMFGLGGFHIVWAIKMPFFIIRPNSQGSDRESFGKEACLNIAS